MYKAGDAYYTLKLANFRFTLLTYILKRNIIELLSMIIQNSEMLKRFSSVAHLMYYKNLAGYFCETGLQNEKHKKTNNDLSHVKINSSIEYMLSHYDL